MPAPASSDSQAAIAIATANANATEIETETGAEIKMEAETETETETEIAVGGEPGLGPDFDLDLDLADSPLPAAWGVWNSDTRAFVADQRGMVLHAHTPVPLARMIKGWTNDSFKVAEMPYDPNEAPTKFYDPAAAKARDEAIRQRRRRRDAMILDAHPLSGKFAVAESLTDRSRSFGRPAEFDSALGLGAEPETGPDAKAGTNPGADARLKSVPPPPGKPPRRR